MQEQQAMSVPAFQYINEQGQCITFVPDEIKPFSFLDLLKVKGDKAASFDLEITTNNVDLTEMGHDVKGQAKISQTISFRKKPKVFALVDGGWLPPAFVTPQNLLVDRNVVSTLRKVAMGSSRLDHHSTDWWIRFPASSKILINPVLYALEGCERRIPTFEEFCVSYREASETITKQVPEALVVKYKDENYRSAYQNILDVADKHDRETAFLKVVAPRLMNRVSNDGLARERKFVLESADKFSLQRKSLSVLAALSCLYEKKDGSGLLAARDVLKPNKSYSDADAFNALSDIRALELYIASLSLGGDRPFMCTCDIGIAGLWCGLNPRDIRWGDGYLTFNLSISDSLFPRLKDEERDEAFLLQ